MPRWCLTLLWSVGIAAATWEDAEAATITFAFTSMPPNVGAFFVQSTDGTVNVLLSGVQFNTGIQDPLFQVSRDAEGVGIRSNGDTSDFIEQAGANDRIRFNFGDQSFELLSLTLAFPPGETRAPISIWTGGEADSITEIRTTTGGLFVPSSPLASSVFDFGSESTTGFKITGATFEGPIPEPSTGLLMIAGLVGLAGWRRTRG